MNGILNGNGVPFDQRPEPRKVIIATPAYGGQVSTLFATALTDSIVKAAGQLILCKWVVQNNLCYIDFARNKLVRDFLESDADDLIFIDADVGWKPESFLRLLTWDKDIVGGAYPFKEETEGYPVRYIFDENKRLKQCPETNLIEASYIPTGFMRIRRRVFEKMISVFGKEKLEVVEYLQSGEEKGRYLNFFSTGKVGNQKYGEDVNFCRVWRDYCGGQIWCDPEMDFAHTGNKNYRGNLADYLRREMDRQQAASEDVSAA